LSLPDFNEKTNFLDRLSKKKAQVSHLIEIRPVGAEFNANKQTDGQMDMKIMVAFRNFAKAPNNNNNNNYHSLLYRTLPSTAPVF
jgi:hypothetical protein